MNFFKENKDKYVEVNDVIYKVTGDHLLQLSPWEQGDDRRVYDLDTENTHIISYNNACMIINKQFADKSEHWDFNGKKYLASPTTDKNIEEHTCLLNMLPNHKVMKKVNALMKDLPDDTLSIQSNDGLSELKLVRHKGKIYYILVINEFLPKVQAYDLFGKFCQWCNIKHCKPIYCIDDKKYI